jgi:hypothetical protein
MNVSRSQWGKTFHHVTWCMHSCDLGGKDEAPGERRLKRCFPVNSEIELSAIFDSKQFRIALSNQHKLSKE